MDLAHEKVGLPKMSLSFDLTMNVSPSGHVSMPFILANFGVMPGVNLAAGLGVATDFRTLTPAGPDSDIDLLVVVDDDTPPDRLTLFAGHASRRGYREPADVIPCREATFRRKSRIAGTLAYTASHEGVVVYERT